MQLIFSGHWDRDPGLDRYILALTDTERGQINQWRCTSSHRNGQQRGDQHQRGGIIPPVHHVKNLDNYEVMLMPEDSRHVLGVEGLFYRIMPYQFQTRNGTVRSALGIHRDANAPGSLGCIVMDNYNWDDFKTTMTWVREKYHFDRLPLFVFIT